jgi:hypothetical protein
MGWNYRTSFNWSYPGSECQKSHVFSVMKIIDPKNAIILLDMGHTLRGDHTQEK